MRMRSETKKSWKESESIVDILNMSNREH